MSVSKFVSFSMPIDDAWLEKVSKASRVLVVGSGVTAQEYSYILKRKQISFEFIPPQTIVEEPSLLTGCYTIIACHQLKQTVIEKILQAGFIEGKDFDLFYQCLRNRAVFDFRDGFSFLDKEWFQVLTHLRSYPTIGGIDVFINSKNLSQFNRLINEAVTFTKGYFHTKLTIEVGDYFDFKDIENLPVDLVELLVREDNRNDFNAVKFDSLCNTADFNHAHVVYIDCEMASGEKFSCESQSDHPAYYDLMLSNVQPSLEAGHEVGKLCVSRRMFPVFDYSLNLKTCSLYKALSTTNMPYSDFESVEFINARNKLCIKCKNAGLHRNL